MGSRSDGLGAGDKQEKRDEQQIPPASPFRSIVMSLLAAE